VFATTEFEVLAFVVVALSVAKRPFAAKVVEACVVLAIKVVAYPVFAKLEEALVLEAKSDEKREFPPKAVSAKPARLSEVF